MDPQQTPPGTDSNPPPELQRGLPKQTPRYRRRWPALGLIGALIIVGGLVLWLTHKSQPVSSSKPVQASTPVKSAPIAQSTSTSANHWKGTVDPAAIPLGDDHVSTAPEVGFVDSCTTSFKGGGARHAGSWINATNTAWNSETKVAVEGSVQWPSADYSETTSGSSRVLTTNDLPETYPTGIFPISRNDPAYQFDTNPNHIGTQSLSYSLPLNPAAAAAPSCLSLGPIGVLSDGVALFNALDAAGRDAVAHETQDLCDGHPDGTEMYHYHNVPSCLRDKATDASTLVGYALDGYGIYVERDSKGNLPTNADLDACHGRTSQVTWNGKPTTIYHYDATLEYPYTVGCFHGTPVAGKGGRP